MIQAKTAILIGCRKIIRVDGGPKDMTIVSHSESKQVQIRSVGDRGIEISSEKEGIFEVVIQSMYRGDKVALIMVSVTASRIESIELQSIEEPVVNAHFRIYPKFKVGQFSL